MDDDVDTTETLKRVSKPGVIYFSSVPPYMKPNKMRNIMSQFGEVGRIFLQPEDAIVRKRRKMSGGSGKKKFTEAWVEFKKKRIAKAVVASLNGNIIGGKKGSYYHDDIWTMRYLPRFKWANLTEKLAYDAAVRKKRLQKELDQVKKEANFYAEQMDKNKQISAIKRKRQKKSSENEVSENSNQQPGPSKPLSEIALDTKKVKQRKSVNATNRSNIPANILKNVFTQ